MNAASKIQAIMNTLQELNIPATVDNMSKLLGCQQTLADVRDEMQRMQQEVKANADTDV